MGLLTFALNVTLDGCNDHREGIADNEMLDYFTHLMDEAGAMLFGRTTYELMESAWPAVARDEKAPRAMREWAVKLEAKPKYVVSASRHAFPWVNTVRVEGDLHDAVKQLKESLRPCWRAGRRYAKRGSLRTAQVISLLSQSDLVDSFSRLGACIARCSHMATHSTPGSVDLRIELPERMQRIHVLIRLAILLALGAVGCSSLYWILYLGLPAIAALLIAQKGAGRYFAEDAPGMVRALRWFVGAYAYLWLLADAPQPSDSGGAAELRVAAASAAEDLPAPSPVPPDAS
jgi:hypothetical protein